MYESSTIPQGIDEGVKGHSPKDRFYTSPQPCPVASRDIALKSKQEQKQINRKARTSSSALVCAVGEVARSDEGVKKQKNDNIKRFLHLSPVVSRSITGVAEQYRGDTSETVVSEERG